jgi:hypothetical protein
MMVTALEVILESKGSTVQKQTCGKFNYDPIAVDVDLLEGRVRLEEAMFE